jgi:hypothetical protein
LLKEGAHIQLMYPNHSKSSHSPVVHGCQDDLPGEQATCICISECRPPGTQAMQADVQGCLRLLTSLRRLTVRLELMADTLAALQPLSALLNQYSRIFMQLSGQAALELCLRQLR